ncbi:MAG: ATP-binding protein [Desulfonauticus sp.]|nr:ATP-binding protein [Desulfonauticus sp.]
MFVERSLFKKILLWLDSPHILIIKGARRAGKTTLLKFIEEHLKKQGRKTAFLPVDQYLFEPYFKTPQLFERYLRQEGLLGGERLYLFLDEVQYLSDPGLFLKILYDRLSPELKIIVSGSSSLEISRTKEFLTGRKVEFILERFSFLEFLWAVFPKELWKEAPFNSWDEIQEIFALYQKQLKECFVDYVTWGGYPEVVLTSLREQKETILREILSTYLQKDVAGFLNVGNISAFNHLVRILASQIGSLLNKSELADTLKIRFETVSRYLDILEGTFIFHLIRPYFSNVRKELSKNPKVYARDFGIIYFSLRRIFDAYEEVSGHEVENFVFRELMEQFSLEDIYFYRTRSGAEIDFLVFQEKIILLECKFRNQIRIPKIFSNFEERHFEKETLKIIITKDRLEKLEETYFIPAYLFPLISLKSLL